MLRRITTLALAMILGASTGTASAAPLPIPNFGAIVDEPGAQMRPDPKMDYRVVFGVTKAGPAADKPNPSLDRVARFVNLLAHFGVPRDHIHVVAIISGPATGIIARTREVAASSPDAPLVGELIAAGVTVALCSQAAHGHGITAGDLLPGVRMDVSAITTIATLQAQGYSYLPD